MRKRSGCEDPLVVAFTDAVAIVAACMGLPGTFFRNWCFWRRRFADGRSEDGCNRNTKFLQKLEQEFILRFP